MPIISRRRRAGTGAVASPNATHLTVTQQPVGGASGLLTQQPVVAAQNAGAATDTSYVGTVVPVLNVLTGSATLGGSEAAGKACVAGVCTFTNLTVTSAGNATWTITFSSGSLTSATSSTGTTTASGGFTTITDSFTAADGTLLAGRTTDTGSKVWQAVVGTFKIVGNQAAPLSTSGGDMIVFDAGVTAGTYKFTVGAGSSLYAGLVFRMSDSLNYWKLIYGSDWRLYSVAAGVASSRASATAAFTPGDVVGVTFDGTSAQITINGTLVGSPTTFAFNMTASKVGLFLVAGNAAARWDNVSVTVP